MPRKRRSGQSGGRRRGTRAESQEPTTVIEPGRKPEKRYPMLLAAPGLRLYAYLVDLGLLATLWIVGSIATQGDVISTQLTAAPNIIVAWAYFIIPTGLKGQTVGKWVAGIVVVDEEGRVPGVAMAIPREMVGRVVAIAAAGVGLAWLVGDKNRQGWHDKIAGTYVVRKTDASAPGPFKKLGRLGQDQEKSS